MPHFPLNGTVIALLGVYNTLRTEMGVGGGGGREESAVRHADFKFNALA